MEIIKDQILLVEVMYLELGMRLFMLEKNGSFLCEPFKSVISDDFKNDKNSFLYELALQRGKSRGWYPETWTLQDYMKHIFCRNLKSVY